MARMIQPTKDAIRDELALVRSQLHDAVNHIAYLERVMRENRQRLIMVGSIWSVVMFFAGLVIGRIS